MYVVLLCATLLCILSVIYYYARDALCVFRIDTLCMYTRIICFAYSG